VAFGGVWGFILAFGDRVVSGCLSYLCDRRECWRVADFGRAALVLCAIGFVVWG